MAFVYVLSELRSIVRVRVLVIMLAKPHVERAASLAEILLVACGAFEFIYSIHVIFAPFISFMCIQKFAQIAGGSVGHFYVGVF